MQAAARGAEKLLPEPVPQDPSNRVRALARPGLLRPPLLEAAAHECLSKMPRFDPQNPSNAARASTQFSSDGRPPFGATSAECLALLPGLKAAQSGHGLMNETDHKETHWKETSCDIWTGGLLQSRGNTMNLGCNFGLPSRQELALSPRPWSSRTAPGLLQRRPAPHRLC